MKWASLLLVLAAGCGSIPTSDTPIEQVLNFCNRTIGAPSELILESIEISERLRREVGFTFSEEIDRIEENCDGGCRECLIVVAEFVHFGIVP